MTTPMSFGLRTTVPMSNENEISNSGADVIWVENDDADDLGEANLTARLGWGAI